MGREESGVLERLVAGGGSCVAVAEWLNGRSITDYRSVALAHGHSSPGGLQDAPQAPREEEGSPSCSYTQARSEARSEARTEARTEACEAGRTPPVDVGSGPTGAAPQRDT